MQLVKLCDFECLFVAQILRTLIGKDVTAITPTNPIANSADEEAAGKESLVGWCPWKMGIVFSHRGRTLLVVKEENNVAPETNDDLEWLPAKKRIEIHVYVQEWFEVQSELELAGHSATMLQNTFSLPGIATQLLVKISQHILSLAHDWFRGMLQNELIYIPCWKCYGQMVPNVDKEECKAVCKRQSRYFPVSRRDETFPVFAFNHEKCIIIAARDQDLRCPIHGPIKVVHTAPDLVSAPMQYGQYTLYIYMYKYMYVFPRNYDCIHILNVLAYIGSIHHVQNTN